MEDLRCHSVHSFFKIFDAEMYGGVGSVGYACSNANHCLNFPKTLEEEVAYTDSIKKDFAKIKAANQKMSSGYQEMNTLRQLRKMKRIRMKSRKRCWNNGHQDNAL